jgi:cellulose synthase (UDP-forming)
VMMQNYLYGRVRWPWVSELYEYVQSIYLFRAIVSVIFNPRKPTFNVTAKSLTLDEDQLSELSRPYFGMFFLLLAGFGVGVWRLLTEPVFNDLLVVVMVWNALNLVIAAVALGAVSERRELRRAQRLDIERRGILIAGGVEVPVIIEDVSSGGARVRTLDGELPTRREGETIGTLVVDQVRDDVPVRSLSVIMRRIEADGAEDVYGLQFIQLTPTQMRLVADLMYGNFMVIEQLREARRRQKSVLGGTLQFVIWSVQYSLRAFGVAIRTTGRKAQPAQRPAAARKPEVALPQAPPAHAPVAAEAKPVAIAAVPAERAPTETAA